MKILFVHDHKRIRYGAHYVNDLLVTKLKKAGHKVDNVYPEEAINLFSKSLKGINNILFFYSLIQKRNEVKKYDLVWGTTYTPLAFLNGKTKVVSHFGSTSFGFLKSVPSLSGLHMEQKQLAGIFNRLKRYGIVEETNAPLQAVKDISKIEMYVAKQSYKVVAATEIVKRELERGGVPSSKIRVMHNMLEDYWFRNRIRKQIKPVANLVYLGRLGDDGFTVKLKGITRLLYLFEKFPKLEKMIIGITEKTDGYHDVFSKIPKTSVHLNVRKNFIPKKLENHYGDIYVNTSRYEGFCLSLVESMSQGLIPIVFPFGVAPEIIQDGLNGYLVNSLSEFRRKTEEILTNRARRALMAEAAITTARRFRSKNLLKDYLGFCEELNR